MAKPVAVRNFSDFLPAAKPKEVKVKTPRDPLAWTVKATNSEGDEQTFLSDNPRYPCNIVKALLEMFEEYCRANKVKPMFTDTEMTSRLYSVVKAERVAV